MRYITRINEKEEERVEIFAHKRSKLVEQIENLCENDEFQLYGYFEDEKHILDINDIQRIFIENDKLIASVGNVHYKIKSRLYLIEEKLGNNFIKINQSCLVNKHYIKCFKSSWKGSFLVELKNGEKDFISRRQTKIVLERMGLK